MIQKIKKEIENNLESNYSDRSEIIYNLSKLLDNQQNQRNLYGYKIDCDDSEDKHKNNIDIFIQLNRSGGTHHLNIIYFGNKARKLRELRKKKLEQVYGTT